MRTKQERLTELLIAWEECVQIQGMVIKEMRDLLNIEEDATEMEDDETSQSSVASSDRSSVKGSVGVGVAANTTETNEATSTTAIVTNHNLNFTTQYVAQRGWVSRVYSGRGRMVAESPPCKTFQQAQIWGRDFLREANRGQN